MTLEEQKDLNSSIENYPFPSILVVIPSYNGSLDTKTQMGLSELEMAFNHLKIKYSLQTVDGNSNIDMGRTLIANDFVNKSDFDSILWIDADVGFSIGDVLKLILTNEDFVCGAYRKKRDDNISYAVSIIKPYEFHALHPAVSAEWVVFGFVLLKKRVFDVIREHCPDIIYKKYSDENKKYCEKAFYFHSIAWKENLWGEDVGFCKLWTEAGGKIWLRHDITGLTHSGRKIYTSSDFYNDLFTRNNGNIT